MKRLITLGLGVLAAFACQKEFVSELKPESAKTLELKAYAKMASLTKSEQYEFFEQKRMELAELQKTNSTQDYDIEDAFLALEGFVNNDFYEQWEDFMERVDYSPTFDLAFSIIDNQRKVNIQEFAQVYTEIYNEVSGLIDVNNNEMLLMVDLTIESIDDQAQLATLKAIISIATKPAGQVFFTPSDAVTGTKWATGLSNLEGTATFDAADYIRVYANTTAPWRNMNCPNYFYLLPTGGMNTYNFMLNNPIAFPSYADWQQNVIPKYWKSNTNDCLGSPDPFDWYPYYNKIDQLIAYGLNKNRLHYGNNALEFFYTDYHSHVNQTTGPGSDPNPDILELFYHGGSVFYGFVICN